MKLKTPNNVILIVDGKELQVLDYKLESEYQYPIRTRCLFSALINPESLEEKESEVNLEDLNSLEKMSLELCWS